MARTSCFLAAREFIAPAVSRRNRAARMVPAQVRKSLAVKSSPVTCCRYSLTSAESMALTSPSPSTHLKSSCPGISRNRLMIRAILRSCNSTVCCFPLLPRKRSEEHTSELQSQSNLVCRLLLEKKKTNESKTLPLKHVHPPSHSSPPPL